MRRRIIASAIVIATAGGLVAGCGDSAPPPADTATATVSTAATGTTAGATEAVDAAFATLRKASYTSTSTATQEIDTSGVPDAVAEQVQKSLEQTSTDITSTTRVESPERVETTQKLGGREQQVVLYDGSVYVSANGTTWAEVTGDAAAAFDQASSLAQVNPSDLFSDITSAGTTDVEGKPAQQYDARIDTAKASELVASVVGGLGDLGSALGSAVSIDNGSAVIAVDDASGAVSRMQTTLRIGLDLGALASAAGQSDSGLSGTVGITSASTETVTDFGGDITVTKPTATTTVSTIAGLGEFLVSG